MKNLILTVLLFGSASLAAQNIHFIKSYGNNGYDYGRDIKQDIDTGYIATGSSSSFTSGNADVFLLKVDSLGNFKWSRNYGGPGSEWGESVVTTQNDGYAVAGYTNSFGMGGFDFFFIKTNANGVPEIEKTYGGSDWDKAYDLVELPDGGFIMVGETYSFGEGNNDMYMVRIDAIGDTVWTRTHGGPEADYANAVLLDGDSIVVVGGTKSFGNGMTDGIILKYHINGTLGWTKTAGMERDDYFTSITGNGNGNYFLGGTRQFKHFQDCNCGYDFWVYHTDSLANLIIDTSWTGEQLGTDYVFDIAVDPLNNQILYAGSTTSWGSDDVADNITDAFINKLVTNLNYFTDDTFVKNFGTLGNEEVSGIDLCLDRGLVGIGTLTYNSTGGSNIFIVRVDRLNTGGDFDIEADLINDIITLSLEEENEKTSLMAYPTIVDDYITVSELPLHNHIAVFSLGGRKVLELTNTPEQINLHELMAGAYILRVQTEEKFYNFRIIKR